MSIKRHNLAIDCSQCQFRSASGGGSFDVVVPVSDTETGTAGPAKLHCSVTLELHAVELTEWRDEQGQIIEPPDELRHRLSEALGFVAERRICGNHRLCPTEVVRVVEQASAT